MARVAKIAIMFVVYLAWICGNPAIALSCHANQKQHTHCCKSCECHHENCEKVHFEVPHGCHHDHSNTIALYDTVKKNDLNIEPVELSITAQISENLSIEDVISVRSSRYYERKVPIPITPTLSGSGLRAPPVIA
jgi:hypothetical protein